MRRRSPFRKPAPSGPDSLPNKDVGQAKLIRSKAAAFLAEQIPFVQEQQRFLCHEFFLFVLIREISPQIHP